MQDADAKQAALGMAVHLTLEISATGTSRMPKAH
jgi:hypothetical protein